MYGREKLLGQPERLKSTSLPLYEVPTFTMNTNTPLVAFQASKLGRMNVHHVRMREDTLLLEKVVSCATCPAKGRCSIEGICVSYHKDEYEHARQELQATQVPERTELLEGPTVKDYQAVERFRARY